MFSCVEIILSFKFLRSFHQSTLTVDTCPNISEALLRYGLILMIRKEYCPREARSGYFVSFAIFFSVWLYRQ